MDFLFYYYYFLDEQAHNIRYPISFSVGHGGWPDERHKALKFAKDTPTIQKLCGHCAKCAHTFTIGG